MTAPTMPIRTALTAAALAALAGAAHAGVVSWASPVSGDWSLGANWSSGAVPAPTDAAAIGVAGAYTVTVNGGFSVTALDVSNPSAGINVNNGSSLSITSGVEPSVTLTNDGYILVNAQPGSSTTSLNIGAVGVPGHLLVGPNGTGEVDLNVGNVNGDLNDATLDIRAGGTHGLGHTVRGKGRVNGEFTNHGLVLADRVGQELRISGTVTQSATGVMRATAEGVLGIGDGGSVSGGTITTDTLGLVRVNSGTATLLGGVILDGEAGVANARVLNIGAGGITNNGVITHNYNQGSSTTQIVVTADTTIAGTGSIDLNVANINGGLNDATLTTDPGVTATIGADQSVTGKGLITGTWINNGQIHADRADQELRITAEIAQDAAGVLRATGGTVGFANGADVSGGLVMTDAGGIVASTIGTSTIGGGLHNMGDMGVRNGTVLVIGPGGIVNDGAFTVNTQQGSSTTSMIFSASEAITGTGTIDLNVGDINGDLGDARIITDIGITATLGSGQTVTGKGQLNGDFVLLGTVEADRMNQDLQVEGTLDASGGGVIRATDGAFAVIDNCAVTGATLDSDTGGAVHVRNNSNTFDAVTNNGDAGVRTGSTLSLISDFTNHGTFTINTQTGTSTTTCVVSVDGTAFRGTGTTVLNIGDINNDLSDARIQTDPGVTAINRGNHTIAGKGRVDGDWINNGIIAGDRPGQDLQVQGTFDQTGGGVIRGDNGGFALIRDGVISGGTFDSSSGGAVHFLNNGNALDGVTNSGEAGLRSSANVELRAGGLTNNGMLTINSNAGTSSTAFRASADATIDGTGTVALGISEINSDLTDATLGADEGFTLTVGPGQTITGKGRLHGVVNVEGTIAPGNNPGGDEIDAIYPRPNGASEGVTLAASSEFAVEAIAEEVNDALSSTVPVTLDGGTLRFTPINGFEPPRPTRYTIITAPEITGTFGTLIYEGVVPEGGVFRVVYEDEEVIAAVTCQADIAAPIGILDLNDITFFTQLFLTGSLLVDLNEDGLLDLTDIGIFVQEFLAGCG